MNLILSENASASSVFAVEEARFPILPRIFGRSERSRRRRTPVDKRRNERKIGPNVAPAAKLTRFETEVVFGGVFLRDGTGGAVKR